MNRRIIIATIVPAIVLALVALNAGGGTALACHEHTLTTPGTVVEDIASGQTSKEEGEGGYHAFHVHVHKGVPGDNTGGIGANSDGAFQNENNPVSVVGAPFQATCD